MKQQFLSAKGVGGDSLATDDFITVREGGEGVEGETVSSVVF